MLRSQPTGIPRSPSVSRRTQTAATHKRSGTVAVEFAIVLPLIVVLILGAIEIGRAVMVQQSLVAAARAGARLYGVTADATEADVQQMVDAAMAKAKITGYSVTLTPASTVGLARLEPVSVAISVPYDQVAWLPTNWLTAGATLTGQCTMPVDDGGTPSSEPPPDGGGDDDDDDDGFGDD